MPLAVYGELSISRICLRGLIPGIDGKDLIKDEIFGDPEEPESLGRKLAEKLLKSGGEAILRKIYQNSFAG